MTTDPLVLVLGNLTRNVTGRPLISAGLVTQEVLRDTEHISGEKELQELLIKEVRRKCGD